MATIKLKENLKKDQFETFAWNEGFQVCGVDEVGRGCLAGPVVTAAAILKPGKKSSLIQDSKLLTQPELQKAYLWLSENSIYAFSVVNHRDIDSLNIYQATLKAMKRSIMQLFGHLTQLPASIVIDAMPLSLGDTPYKEVNVYHFPFGEKRSTSIAAASIIAKVHRDRIMRRLSPVFPHYSFEKHKGYATKVHQEALRAHGHSIIHRLRFISNKEFSKDFADAREQQTICGNY